MVTHNFYGYVLCFCIVLIFLIIVVHFEYELTKLRNNVESVVPALVEKHDVIREKVERVFLGSVGPTANQGSAGDPGCTGNRGAPGNHGEHGEKGATGNQ